MTVALVALLVAVASPAAAFDLFGLRIFGGDKDDAVEDVIGDPQHYSVEFDVLGDDEAVTEALNAASLLVSEREKPASGSGGLIAKARGDYQRLLAALYTEGYYGGSISILIDGREAGQLAPDANLPDPATVVISVDPGPLFHFGRAEIVNRAPSTDDPDDKVAAPEDEGFAPGEVARSGKIKRAGRLAVEAWRQQGHAKAKVAERRVEAAHDRNVLDTILTLRPGRKAYYGPVTVEGNDRMDPEFVAYMADLPPGGEYDPDDLKRAEERLARLGVFASARTEEAEAIGPDGILPISIVVQERLRRRFGVGGTFSTVDGLGLQAFWQHRNLFGRAEQLKLEATVANIGNSLDPDALTYKLAAMFLKPGVFTPDTNFVAQVIGIRESIDPYVRTAAIAEAGYTHIASKNLSLRMMARVEHARFTDATFGRRDFTMAGLVAGATWDSRDVKNDATEGFYADVEVEPFHEFNFANTVMRGTAEVRAYAALDAGDRFVLAGRIKAGMLAGAPIAQTPPDKLFFAGGGGSVRGYGYRNIGIVTPAGTVTGGRSVIEGSAEIRTRINEAFGAVAFVDFGTVGINSFPDFSQPVRVGVGGGIRYYTGLGPLRLDVAVPLNRRAGDPSFAVYVGIGQAF
ncbi:MAG: autotransporter assembly complex family protein [Rhizobiaceae bacterium]